MRRMGRGSTAGRCAFTLVELLVVTAIIAMIMGMLLPAISRARQRAQRLQCASNLRTLGQLLTLHADDHRGYLPLAGAIAPGPTGAGLDNPSALGDPQQQRYDYYDNGGGLICVTVMPAALAPYIINRPINADSWQDVNADVYAPGPLQDAFLCPCDGSTIQRLYQPWLWISNRASGTYLGGWTSYGINEEIFGWADAGAIVINSYYTIEVVTGHSRARGKISCIPDPSETMLMCDTYRSIEVWVEGPNLSLGDVYTQQPPKAVGHTIFDLSRHGGTMNILYADGHVGNIPILSAGATTAVGAVGTSGNSPSGELMSVSMDKGFR